MAGPGTQQLLTLRRLHERRLYALQERQAREGNNTPPEVLTEIEDIERKLQELDTADRVVNGGAVSAEVLAILRQISPNDALIKTQFIQSEQIRDLGKSVTTNTATIERIEERVDGIGREIPIRLAAVQDRVVHLVYFVAIGFVMLFAALVWLIERIAQ